MAAPLFTVENTFAIRGRGLVILGFRFGQHPLFTAGDVLQIDRPDGSRVRAVIRGVEPPVGTVYVGEPPPRSERRYGLLIDIDDVPVGSVVTAGMPRESRTIIDYALPPTPKPRRLWLPVAFLSLALVVWNRSRLTPTGFPNALDWAALVVLAASVFVMARYSSLPGWAFLAYGAAAAGLFLFANLNDNNFRANTNVKDVIVIWPTLIAGGALASRVIAAVGRAGTS